MCGIAGVIDTRQGGVAPGTANALADSLARRGPDDHGVLMWEGEGAFRLGREAEALGPGSLCLVHRRLSIIDESEGGWQPMTTEDGRHAIVFNGEIYNYVELREELERAGLRFRSTSDTEVLLKALVHWGLDALPRLVGMFAFALLDRAERRLVLARDVFGIKPLVFRAASGRLAFASEIKALLAAGEAEAVADPQALYDYLRFGMTERGHGGPTLFAGVRRLAPAHYAVIDLDHPDRVTPRRYWSPPEEIRDDLSFEAAASHLRDLFMDSVALHLRSDVRVGAALSGGIDSSAVVMAMRAVVGESLDLHTFSYIADDPSVSEERWVDLVAARAGATVHKVGMGPDDMARDLDAVIACQDEPFVSSSMVAQYRVFEKVRAEGIKVTLDGQGADEMLAGYPNYFGARLASLVRAGRMAGAARFLRASGRVARFGTKGVLLRAGGHFLPGVLQAPARALAGERLMPSWMNAGWFRERGVMPMAPRRTATDGVLRGALHETLFDRSLPSLLRYQDRNSMHHSVESRVPFLTPEIASFVLSLPEDYVIAPDATTKAVFRAAMRGIVPDAVLDRRDKIGFETPQVKLIAAVTGWARGILSAGAHAPLPVFDQVRFRADVDAVLENGTPMLPHVWRWLNLIRWAQIYGVRFT